MTIVNIWSKVDKIEEYLSWNTILDNLFVWGISAGKPIIQSEGLSLYFALTNNSVLVNTSRKDGKNLVKRALFEFVIVSNNKAISNVEMYEALDTLSNEICEKHIDLDGFTIYNIFEENQSWVIVDTNENPILIAQYNFDYKSKY